MAKPEIVLLRANGSTAAIRAPVGGFIPKELAQTIGVQGDVYVELKDGLLLSSGEIKPGEVLEIQIRNQQKGPPVIELLRIT